MPTDLDFTADLPHGTSWRRSPDAQQKRRVRFFMTSIPLSSPESGVFGCADVLPQLASREGISTCLGARLEG